MSITAVPLRPVRKSHLVFLWVGIALAVLVAAALAVAAPLDPNATVLAANRHKAGVVVPPSGLQYKLRTKGVGGPSPTDADVALVMYEGKLANGQMFDASQQPSPLPVAGVVPGFSEGLKLMHKGDKMRFWIPPALGYGKDEKRDPATGKVAIPANSVLVFDVQLLDFKSEAVVRQMMMQQRMMSGGGMPGGVVPGGPGGTITGMSGQ